VKPADGRQTYHFEWRFHLYPIGRSAGLQVLFGCFCVGEGNVYGMASSKFSPMMWIRRIVPSALVSRKQKAIYQKTGFRKNFCVFQELNHEFQLRYLLEPCGYASCLDDGLFATYRKIRPC